MLQNIKTYLTESPFITRSKSWLESTSLPGFQGVSLYNVGAFLYNETFLNPMLMMRANAIAFSFFMSLFPAFLVIFSLIPFLPLDKADVLKQIHDGIVEIMPNKSGEDLFNTVKSFVKTKRTDFLSIGFVLAIYFASNGLMALMRGFEKNHAVFRKRNIWEKRIRAISMTFLLGILLFISTFLIILGNQLFKWLFKLVKLSAITATFLDILRWLIVLASIYFGIAIIYKFGVAMRRRMHFFSPGASVATVLSLLSSIGFSFYVDTFGNYNKLYGSFVAGIVLLLWLQLNAIILIIGFELNAAIAVNRDLTIVPLEKIELEQNDDFESVF
jgi:membrane protein